MTETMKDEGAMPETKGAAERKPYAAPALRRLGSVRELTAGGTSPTMVDGLMMRPM